MTKKDFETFAAIIASNLESARPNRDKEKAICLLALDMIDHFESVNPRFKRSKFIQAANMYPTKKL